MQRAQEAEYMTTEEVSAKFNIKPGTLKSWRRDRRCGDVTRPRYHIIGGRLVRYKPDEIKEDIDKMDVTVEPVYPPVLRSR